MEFGQRKLPTVLAGLLQQLKKQIALGTIKTRVIVHSPPADVSQAPGVLHQRVVPVRSRRSTQHLMRFVFRFERFMDKYVIS